MSGVSLDIWDEPQNVAPARQPNPSRDAHMQPVQQRPPVPQLQQQARPQQSQMNYQQMPVRHQTMAPEPAKMAPVLTPQQQQFRPQVYATSAYSEGFAPPMPPPPFRTLEPIGTPKAVVDPNQDLGPTIATKCMDFPVWFKIFLFSMLGLILIVVFQLNKLINVLEKK